MDAFLEAVGGDLPADVATALLGEDYCTAASVACLANFALAHDIDEEVLLAALRDSPAVCTEDHQEYLRSLFALVNGDGVSRVEERLEEEVTTIVEPPPSTALSSEYPVTPGLETAAPSTPSRTTVTTSTPPRPTTPTPTGSPRLSTAFSPEVPSEDPPAAVTVHADHGEPSPPRTPPRPQPLSQHPFLKNKNQEYVADVMGHRYCRRFADAPDEDYAEHGLAWSSLLSYLGHHPREWPEEVKEAMRAECDNDKARVVLASFTFQNNVPLRILLRWLKSRVDYANTLSCCGKIGQFYEMWGREDEKGYKYRKQRFAFAYDLGQGRVLDLNKNKRSH